MVVHWFRVTTTLLCGSATREIPRTVMAESAVLKGILTAVGSWRRFIESTYQLLRIGHVQSYAGNLVTNNVLVTGRTQWGLLFPKLNVSCLFQTGQGPIMFLNISILELILFIMFIIFFAPPIFASYRSAREITFTICGFIDFCNCCITLNITYNTPKMYACGFRCICCIIFSSTLITHSNHLPRNKGDFPIFPIIPSICL